MGKNIEPRTAATILAAVLIVAAGTLWYVLGGQNGTSPQGFPPVTSQTSTTTQPASQVSTSSMAPQPINTIIVTSTLDMSHWKSYSDPQGAFSFSYPQDYVVEPGDSGANAYYIPIQPGFVDSSGTVDSNGTMMVTVALPQTAYPNTSFEGAYFSVSTDNLSPSACAESFEAADIGVQSINSATTTVLDGVTFYQFTSQGAALGHSGGDIYYHGMVGNTCYELDEGIRNDDTATIPVDFDPITQQLDAILSTIAFH